MYLTAAIIVAGAVVTGILVRYVVRLSREVRRLRDEVNQLEGEHKEGAMPKDEESDSYGY